MNLSLKYFPEFADTDPLILKSFFKNNGLEEQIKKIASQPNIQKKIQDDLKKPENKGKDSLICVKAVLEHADFKKIDDAIIKANFKNVILPVVLQTEEELKKNSNQGTEAAIKNYLSPPVDANEHDIKKNNYGKLSIDLLLEIGELVQSNSFVGKQLKGFEEPISNWIGNALFKVSQSPLELVTQLIEKRKAIKAAIPKAINSVLDDQKKIELTSEKVNELFESEIAKTAGLLYDLIDAKIEKGAEVYMPIGLGWVAGLVKKAGEYVLPNVVAYNKAIKNCFDKMLGNELLNANIVSRVQDVLLTSLGTAYQKKLAMEELKTAQV